MFEGCTLDEDAAPEVSETINASDRTDTAFNVLFYSTLEWGVTFEFATIYINLKNLFIRILSSPI